MKRALCALGILFFLAWPASAQKRTYEEWVAAYLRGEPGAVGAVRAMFDPMFSGERNALLNDLIKSARRAHRERIAGALMLHTEVVFSARDEADLPTRTYVVHLAAVDRLHAALRDIAPRTPFIRQWYLLVESFRHRFSEPDSEELDYLDTALKMFPGDAELLLACGSRHEVAWLSGSSNPRVDVTDTGRVADRGDRNLQRAAECFRRSVAIAPDSSEARLRLGHTLMQLGELTAAAGELQRLQQPQEELAFRYLGELFMGELEERRGNRQAAAAAYTAASVLVPAAQSARVAGALLQYAEGDRRQAADTVNGVLTETSPASDPWWLYILGEWWRFETYLQAAQTLVRS
jgi:hypothetical protein